MRIKLLILIFLITARLIAQKSEEINFLNQPKLAKKYFDEDAQWYVDNIPFFECSDKQIEQVYFYRWKMYKAHIRNTGPDHYVVTEFINHVAWDRDPFCTINAASMHHIYEGRWLKDDRFMNGYIHYLYQEGGNNRRYSESIADAVWARYLVNSDKFFILQQLDSMKYSFEQWNDHLDTSKNLYYIPAMPDATEYTIASIDASGGKDGFEGGEAFRPTINSYMYANALAISKIAAIKGDNSGSEFFAQRAESLKKNVENYLWNDSLNHFTDRYQADNQYVHYWDFIRGRELAGMIPWYFNLPSDTEKFHSSWIHVLDTTQLLGKYGLRTNEPSYEYYFRQFVYCFGKRGSQWNGPSWPYQTSQVLTGMANLLNNYHQDVVTNSDYLHLLRLFTQQHYLPDGKINLVENYDPNLGGPIVHYYWSNHYNHSSYNNLIISGLCGIQPSESDTLNLNPLIDKSIEYFCLDDVRYHGHKLTVIYDQSGKKYHLGQGIHVFVDGKKTNLIKNEDKFRVLIGSPEITRPTKNEPNLALNIEQKGFPVPSASVNSMPDTTLFQAIDGRIWYFPEITNHWTTIGSESKTDWYAIDFGQVKEVSEIRIYPIANGKSFDVPDRIYIEYFNDNQWLTAKIEAQKPFNIVGNTINSVLIEKCNTSKIRINFIHHRKQVAISEIECY